MSEALIASSSRELERERRERSRDRSREDSSNSAAARTNSALHHSSWQTVARQQDPMRSTTPRSQSAGSGGDPLRPTAIRDYESEAADNLEVFGESTVSLMVSMVSLTRRHSHAHVHAHVHTHARTRARTRTDTRTHTGASART